MISTELVQRLAAAWGLCVVDVSYPEAGTMNDVAILTTDRCRVVLRGHRRLELARVQFEHEVMDWARTRGVPVPDALTTPTGARIVTHEGRWFSLAAHAEGEQVARDALGRDEAGAMGRCLARVHAALSEFPAADAPRASTGHTYEETLRRIEILLEHARANGVRDEQEQWALERLVSRAQWMSGRPEPDIPKPDDEQLVHGDFHDANLFFAAGEVSAVIDWDKAEVRSRGQEVIRAMQHSFGFDPTLCQAFVAGYQTCATLTDDELAMAALGYGHVRDCDLWLAETIFLDRDDRPKRFVTPGPFAPFTEIWEPVLRAIVAMPEPQLPLTDQCQGSSGRL